MAATTPPLSLGEILDRTIQLYRRNFLLLIGIAFPAAALYVLVYGGVGIFFTSRAASLQNPGANGEAIAIFMLVLAAFFLVGMPLLLAIYTLSLSALNYAAFHRNRGEALTFSSAYSFAFRRFWRYCGILFFQFLFAAIIPGAVFTGIFTIGAVIAAATRATGAGTTMAALFGFTMIIAFLGLMVVCVWIWLRYCLAFPAAITEETTAWASIQRSGQLSKGSRGRIFVMYLLVVVLTLVAYYALVIPLDIILKLTVYKSLEAITLFTKPPVPLQVINLFISFLERAFVLPIYAIALLLFYNDQRTRHEGYDIELLMAQAGWAELPPSPAPIPAPWPAAQPAPSELTAAEPAPPISPELTPPPTPETTHELSVDPTPEPHLPTTLPPEAPGA